MDRLFLDANVVFSAAYIPESSLSRLWELKNVALVTSYFVIEEARRNLAVFAPPQLDRLNKLFSSMERSDRVVPVSLLPPWVKLPPKDLPILLTAIGAGCSHLLTGDIRHFGELFGKKASGVLIQRPKEYLSLTTEVPGTKLV